MGSALLSQWVKGGESITVVDPMASDLPDGVTLVKDRKPIADQSFDCIVAAVKPQMFDDVMPDYADNLSDNGYVISIAAGYSASRLSELMGGKPVVRVMPNLPAAVGRGVSGLCAGPYVTDDHLAHAEEFMRRAGKVVTVENEDRLDRVTAVAGSGPGYVFEIARAYAEAAIRSENSLGLLNITQALIMNLLMGGAMAFTVWGWSRGELTTGDLVLVNTYLMQLFRPLDMLGWVYRTIRQGIIDMAAMFRLIDSEVEVEDVPGAPALVVNRPTVAFENVVFGYEKDRTILHGLSFEVPAGSHVAIVGPSGAGKSTIGRLLFRFYDPQSGRILIDGQDIAQVTQASLRENIGIVPQDSVLFNDSIGYNIAYGRREAEHDLRGILEYFKGVAPGALPNITEDIWRALNLLRRYPAIGVQMEGRHYRRIVSRRYKFKIAYLNEDEAVTVLGIFRYQDREA